MTNQRYTPPTDRVQAHLDGPALHVIFNNPARHNALSVDMWGAGRRCWRRRLPTTACAWWCFRAPVKKLLPRAPTSRSLKTCVPPKPPSATMRRWQRLR